MSNKFKVFILRHKIATAIATLVLVCIWYSRFMEPSLNDKPKQIYEISGSFPFDQGLNLDLKVSYQSNNPTCRQMGRAFLIFPTTESDQRISIHLPIKQVGANKYTAEVALDRYSPGVCEWAYSGMSYCIFGGKQSGTSHDGLGPVPKQLKRLDMKCKYKNIINEERVVIVCTRNYQVTVDSNTELSAELNFLWDGE